MKFYFAPLEGITGYIYRNAYQKYFGKIDKYMTPFISPTMNHDFKGREKKDIIPEHNIGMPVVPQILTNQADAFLFTASKLQEFGYTEINLNLGCPSGTVVSKGRGSGFLAKPAELDQFLYKIYSNTTAKISIKTRLGKERPEEFEEILEIFNKYPIYELTIHPRVRADYYKNKPNLDAFAKALEQSKNPICYNGDITTVDEYKNIVERFPSIDCIMIGRGLLANPGLIREIFGEDRTEWSYLMKFHDCLFKNYSEVMPEVPLLYKMKEIWSYMSKSHPEYEKVWKKIRKSKHMREYSNIMQTLR